MSKKKPEYFPNNWEAFNEAPAEYFEDLPFEQFMAWKVEGFEIPSSVVCLIREEDHSTGKITEYTYQRPHAAKNKVNEIMDRGVSTLTVISGTDQVMHHLIPKYMEESPYDDPLA
jgi:hypothetical protein